MKKRNTKRSLIASIMSLVLCITMLLGTTLAWFTDSVSSGVNRIQAGNLDVELYHTNAKVTTKESVSNQTNLFKDKDGSDMKWEPGAMSYETFTVSNVGTLALKYNMAMNIIGYNKVNGTNYSLLDVLDVLILPEDQMISDPVTRENVADKFASASQGDIKTLADFSKEGGALYPGGSTGASSETFQVLVYWTPGEEDNNWNLNNGKIADDGQNVLYVDFGINLVATQLTSESDSFGPDYDANATYSETVTKTIIAGEDTKLSTNVTPSNVSGNQTTVTFPDSIASFTEGDTAALTVEASPVTTANNKFTVSSTSNSAVGAIDLTVTVNGATVEQFKDSAGDPVDVNVETYVAKNLSGVTLEYNGEPLDAVQYDSDTGRLTFKTNHFSTYVLGAAEVAYVEELNKAYLKLDDAISDFCESSNKTITLLKDLSVSEIISVNTSIVLDGNNKTITSKTGSQSVASKTMDISGSNLNVSLKNITIIENNDINYGRGLQISGSGNTVTLDNCDINALHYAINMTGNADNNKILINNSVISGWAALNIWGSYNIINGNNTTFTGMNDKEYDDKGWNGFGTIVFEGDTTSDSQPDENNYSHDCVISLSNCTISSSTLTDNSQVAFLFNKWCKNDVLKLDACKVFPTSDHAIVKDNGTNNQMFTKGSTTYNGSTTVIGNPISDEVNDEDYHVFDVVKYANGKFDAIVEEK